MLGGEGDDFLRGGDGFDTMHGDAGNDILVEGTGSDTIYGQDGNDILYAEETTGNSSSGLPIDHLNGGNGNDTYYVASEYNFVDETDDVSGGNRYCLHMERR